MLEAQYYPKKECWLALRLRAREKGDLDTYSARAQFDWQNGSWSLRTTAEANMTVEEFENKTGLKAAIG